MRCFGKICCLLSFFSCFLFCAFVTPKDEKYVSYFLHLYSAKLFGEKNFTLHEAKAVLGKDYVHRIEMTFSCYKSLPLKLARELIVEVALDFLDKINEDPGLKEKGLIKGKFIANQLRLKITADNMWGNSYDVTYIREIILDKGRVTYVSFKTVPQFWGKSFTTHEEFEYARMLTGHARPADVAIEESYIKPRLRSFHGDISDIPLRDHEELLPDHAKEEKLPKLISKSVSLEEINLLADLVKPLPPLEAPEAPAVQQEVMLPPKEEAPVEPEPKQEPIEPSPPEPTHELPAEVVAPEEPKQEEPKQEEPKQEEPKQEEEKPAELPPVQEPQPEMKEETLPTAEHPQEKAVEPKEESAPAIVPEAEKAAPEVPAPAEEISEHKEEIAPQAAPVEPREEEHVAPPALTEKASETEKAPIETPASPAEEPRVLVPIEPEPQAEVVHALPKAGSQPPVSVEEGKEGMIRDDSAAEGFFEAPEPVEPQIEKSAAPSATSVAEPAPEPQQIDAFKVVQQNMADLQRATARHEGLFAKEGPGVVEEHVTAEEPVEPKLIPQESFIAVADQQEPSPSESFEEEVIPEEAPFQEPVQKEYIQEEEPVIPPPQPVKIAQKMPHMALGSAHDLPEPQQDTEQFIALPVSDMPRDTPPVIHREIAGTERLKRAEERAHEAFFTESNQEEPLAVLQPATAEEDDTDHFFEEMGY